MAITYLNLEVSSSSEYKKSRTCRFLIDSGAVYSVIPESVLSKLGVKPTDKERFSLANGEVIEKEMGNAFFKYRGKNRGSPVIFGEEGIFLLGAVTLESLGVILDPINRELRPLPMLLMKY